MDVLISVFFHIPVTDIPSIYSLGVPSTVRYPNWFNLPISGFSSFQINLTPGIITPFSSYAIACSLRIWCLTTVGLGGIMSMCDRVLTLVSPIIVTPID